MIVAITGATGFIGRALAQRHVLAGDRVRALTRRDDSGLPDAVEIHRADLTESVAGLAAFADGADVLYHCAAEIRDAARMHTVNVDGTAKLIAAASGRVGRWVQLSSVGAYGPRREGVITEETPCAPRGEYETTKTRADELAMGAARAGAFDCVVLRPSIVFGARMPNESLRQMIRMIARGWMFFVGAPGASANYIHVVNVVEALARCAARPEARGAVFNLSDHRTLEQFVGAIAAALGRQAPSIRVPEAPVRLAARALGRIPGFPLTEARVDALAQRSVYSIERIRSKLGYEHVVSMEDGLRELVASMRG